MKTIAFFNNKGGVGKTTLVYHLAWMYAELGYSVVAVDLDPQANLTTVFLDEDRLEQLWPDGAHPDSILGAVSPILRGHSRGRVAHPQRARRHPGAARRSDCRQPGSGRRRPGAVRFRGQAVCSVAGLPGTRRVGLSHRVGVPSDDSPRCRRAERRPRPDRRRPEPGRHQPGRDHRRELRRLPARPRSLLPPGPPERRADAPRVAPRMAGPAGAPSRGRGSGVAVGRHRAGRLRRDAARGARAAPSRRTRSGSGGYRTRIASRSFPSGTTAATPPRKTTRSAWPP